MALTADDFTRPAGRLDTSWLTDLSTTLAALITEAEAKTTTESAQKAWVYYRAYGMIVDDKMFAAAQRSADDISETITPAQLAYWKALRAGALNDYRQTIGGSPLASGGVTTTTPAW